jgi:phosphoribosylaminoimidazolecarboxamide formyltransferase/IMP cyclohydrolase
MTKSADLRYGENPHQQAALYLTGDAGVANAELLSGKEMSFNNYVDADAAWQLVCDFETTTCAIIKHTNPAALDKANQSPSHIKKHWLLIRFPRSAASSPSIAPSTRPRLGRSQRYLPKW